MKSIKKGISKSLAALVIAAMLATSASTGVWASEPGQASAQTETLQEAEEETEAEDAKAQDEAQEDSGSADAEAVESTEKADNAETSAGSAKSAKIKASGVKSSLKAASAETGSTETAAQSESDNTQATETQTPQTETEVHADGWDSSKTMYYKNGKALTGSQEIDGAKYYFGSDGVMVTGFVTYKDSKGAEQKRYYNESGKKKGQMVTGLVTVNGSKYYFDTNSGNMKTGVRKIDGSYYSFNTKNGKMQYGLKKVKKSGKSIYAYFDKSSGKMRTGYIHINSKKEYYAKSNGKVLYKLKKVRGYWRVYNMKNKRQKDLRKTVLNSKKYQVRINKHTNVVTIVAKFHDGKYSLPVKAWRCSTGKNKSRATPVGTFTIHTKYRWLLMLGGTYCQWLTQISGDYLIHSEIYRSRNNKSMKVSAYNKLGHGASHGCVRMQAVAAKWIYDNCKSGTKIVIFSGSSKKDPLGKPGLKKLPKWHTWDPTDPTAKKYCKKKGCHQ